MVKIVKIKVIVVGKIASLWYNFDMKYEITNDKILIYDKLDFNPKHIFECGQIFRYKNTNCNDYIVFSEDKKAEVIETKNGYEIKTQNTKYFENFFDLKTDYSKIKKELAQKSETLKLATEFGHGIRILNQSPVETVFGFIISANNNIKRIQSLVEKLSKKCGTFADGFYAFPTISQIATLSVDDLKEMGMGFRAKYIFNTAKKLCGTDLESLRSFDTEKLLSFLLTLDGVGPKVADCIALFAYHKMKCFPVDTWVEKIYNSYFANKPISNRVLIRKNLVEQFGNLSGYAQQYLFYYKRELDKKG